MRRSLAVQICLGIFIVIMVAPSFWVAAQTTTKKSAPAQQDRGLITKKTPSNEAAQNQTAKSSANQPQLFIQLGHSQILKAVACSPDGRLVLTGSIDRTARLWDATTGAELKVFTGHTDDVT